MSKNMFILTVCAISFICSCTDTICGDETMKSEPTESHYVVLDSLAIYKIQTDKSMIVIIAYYYLFVYHPVLVPKMLPYGSR